MLNKNVIEYLENLKTTYENEIDNVSTELVNNPMLCRCIVTEYQETISAIETVIAAIKE